MSIKPWLWLPPKLAHDVAPYTMPLLASFLAKDLPPYKEKTWRTLHFKNPLGIAGGVDKNGTTALAWQQLGAGFIEVGTVTPKAQGPNPGKIVDRNLEYKALWNKMGFPNKGAQALSRRLKRIHPHIKVPLFVNVGKNRETENEQAHKDYCFCMEHLSNWADAFVINISSPNTLGLRALQNKDMLKAFLEPIFDFKLKKNLKQPILIKLSPDMKVDELYSTLEVTIDLRVDGWILTNTTTERHPALPFPKEGGVSGAPLAALSKSVLQSSLKYLNDRRKDQLIISAGGIMEPKDITERLSLGADLVQVYSALIFHGPLFFQNSLKALIKSF